MTNRLRRSFWPVVMVVAGIVLVAVASLIITNLQAPPPSVSQPDILTEIPYPDVPRVSLSDAKKAYDDGTAVFVDVRDSASYRQSHIPGALSIPLDELASRENELNPSDWIITYCT